MEASERLSCERGIGSHDVILRMHHSNRTATYFQLGSGRTSATFGTRPQLPEQRPCQAATPLPQTTAGLRLLRPARVDPRTVKDLAALSFVEAKANAALLGPPGVGKTHIVVALAVAACRAG